jgi:hypothetical protein
MDRGRGAARVQEAGFRGEELQKTGSRKQVPAPEE